MSVMNAKQNASKIMRMRESDKAQRTEGCLLATCWTRAKFMKEHGREPTLRECKVTCCYHPDYKPKLKTSTGRSNHIVRRYSY